MPCNCFGPPPTEEQKQSKTIDADLKKQKVQLKKQIKLLLLGAGESGKSTIFKQMKILHDKGYSAEELQRFKKTIYQNTIQAIRALITAVSELGLTYSTEEAKNIALELSNLSEQEIIVNAAAILTQANAHKIKALWKEKAIKQAFEQRATFQIIDSADYYIEAVDRLAQPNYLPNEQDVLRSRLKTVGIVESSFTIDGYQFRMTDVGGQRNERRKWIHCFDDVTAIIFVTSLSEYDQVLFEDDQVNRMTESLTLFGEICTMRYFKQTPFIIFFNKQDLFKKKIQTVDLTVCDEFKEYTGGKDYDKALAHIIQKFEEKNKVKSRPIYKHVTCATDTEQIRVVFNAVKLIILEDMLKDVQMM